MHTEQSLVLEVDRGVFHRACARAEIVDITPLRVLQDVVVTLRNE